MKFLCTETQILWVEAEIEASSSEEARSRFLAGDYPLTARHTQIDDRQGLVVTELGGADDEDLEAAPQMLTALTAVREDGGWFDLGAVAQGLVATAIDAATTSGVTR